MPTILIRLFYIYSAIYCLLLGIRGMRKKGSFSYPINEEIFNLIGVAFVLITQVSVFKYTFIYCVTGFIFFLSFLVFRLYKTRTIYKLQVYNISTHDLLECVSTILSKYNIKYDVKNNDEINLINLNALIILDIPILRRNSITFINYKNIADFKHIVADLYILINLKEYNGSILKRILAIALPLFISIISIICSLLKYNFPHMK